MYRSNEVFLFWDYTPSHRQLLLRCVAENSKQSSLQARNIDITFTNVTYINIPTEFFGIEIVESNYLADGTIVYSITCLKSKSEYYIHANSMFAFENDLHPTISSLSFSRSSPENDSWRSSANYKVLVSANNTKSDCPESKTSD